MERLSFQYNASNARHDMNTVRDAVQHEAFYKALCEIQCAASMGANQKTFQNFGVVLGDKEIGKLSTRGFVIETVDRENHHYIVRWA